ncbi:MAG: acyl-CoA dehydrogenase family protein [Alphaproteobacteria bacterium]|jgi:putative acyl-CoA dehydrogenase|nr:acyl-CoA dehydrogenase family protein [Alphaproteobacteria bacterium]MDP6565001.1 acyl-CoA dehydrogenase family protein [Alphaproteobacteria bacterium]MDP6816293.1 acyl-CoA dehydrogenase family protein [Alphaproteobacteria bacterium]
MRPRNPIANLPTHEVINMPPHMGDQDLFASDAALREGLEREGAGWAADHVAAFGRLAGREETFEWAEQANRFGPEIRPFDRHGMRINQVSFHPAYHQLMDLAIANDLPTFAWNNARPGNHVAHGALSYLLNQAEGGVLCPMSMTYSVVPALKTTPAVADEWLPKLLVKEYDPRDIPVAEKTGITMGMFMTEKQGGSDVRTNTTRAAPAGAETGPGAGYLLNGHKFFCSAPMCDAFLALAYTDNGISCFLLPRWRPEGSRNGLFIQRLKDKVGNKSNASSEMELVDAWGVMVGEEGRGVRTIIEMVNGNRYYCAVSSAALMRQALVQALHYTTHRSAFQRKLIQQPLMRNVLADMAVEVEAATALWLRLGRAIGAAAGDDGEAALARIGTAVAKYWICKRAPNLIFEAMECHGGPGYVEECILPRLYREAPVNSIWEGSGNVVCLDVLRAMFREEAAIPAFLAEVEQAKGGHALLDRLIAEVQAELADPSDLELRARRVTEMLALAMQGSLLVRHAPAAVSDAFCRARLGDRWSGAYGTLPRDSDFDAILGRARGEG